MDTYAIVKLGASQQKVSVGQTVVTDRIIDEVGSKVTVSDVYLVSDNGNVQVGTPTLTMPVVLEVVSHSRGDKVRIHKFKAKSRYKKTKGFRASLTTLKVLSIGDIKAKEEKKEKKVESKVATAKPAAKKTAAKKPAAK